MTTYCIDFSQSLEQVADLEMQQLLDLIHQKSSIEIKSSGSTGTPKSFFFTQEQLEVSASQTNRFFGLDKRSNLLLCLPLNFVAAKLMVVRAKLSRAKLWVVPPSSNPFLNFPNDWTIDLMAMVPTQFRESFQDLKKYRIKNLLLGGASASDLDCAALPSNLYVWEGFGMTETLTHIALKRLHPYPEKAFKTLGDIRVGVDKKGNLSVQYPKLFSGWIQTTDAVKLLDNRTFEWKGRADFVINSGGVKIFPEQVENKIKQYFSANAMVFGEPNEKWGEMVCLIIEKDHPIDLEAIDFEPYTKPKKVYRVPKFCYTPTGKLDRYATIKCIIKE